MNFCCSFKIQTRRTSWTRSPVSGSSRHNKLNERTLNFRTWRLPWHNLLCHVTVWACAAMGVSLYVIHNNYCPPNELPGSGKTLLIAVVSSEKVSSRHNFRWRNKLKLVSVWRGLLASIAVPGYLDSSKDKTVYSWLPYCLTASEFLCTTKQLGKSSEILSKAYSSSLSSLELQ